MFKPLKTIKATGIENKAVIFSDKLIFVTRHVLMSYVTILIMCE